MNSHKYLHKNYSNHKFLPFYAPISGYSLAQITETNMKENISPAICVPVMDPGSCISYRPAKIKLLEDRLQKPFCRLCTFATHRWVKNMVSWLWWYYALQRKSRLCIPFLGIARPQSVSDLYIPRIGPHIWLHQNRQTDPGNMYCISLTADICMSVGIGRQHIIILFWK